MFFLVAYIDDSQDLAHLTHATETLVEDYSLNDVMDGIHTSLESQLSYTRSHIVLEVEVMSMEILWPFINLQELFGYIAHAWI